MATIYGDMEGTLEARAKGQTLVGIDEQINYLYGDAYLIENMRGGNDVLTGGTLSQFNYLYGDALIMSASQGGNDMLTGGTLSQVNGLLGDALQMSGSRGGNDVITGGSNANFNFLFGDANFMSDSQGGNDVLTGGANSGSNSNTLYGDAFQMSASQGGNDVLTGGSSSFSNALYGDAVRMFDSQGGNDVLIGGINSYFNELYGDAMQMSGGQGGNDILIASDKHVSAALAMQSMLYGDAVYDLIGNVICGDDRLISGTGNDSMWGDIAYSGYANEPLDLTRVTTGQDIFVFSANNGADTIHDFRQGEDKIELQGIGVDSFDALMAGSHLDQDNTNTVITFGTNTITVIGVTELTAADFLFT